MNKLTYKQYLDKVRGGWIGKCAGGILGAPIEGYKTFNDIVIDDRLFDNNFPNDDLDIQILWLDMVKKKGPTVRANDYKDHWKNHVDFPWNEYGIATLNIAKGLDNPDTGRHNNGFWNQSMGSPIRSEIWGMICPGSPEKAAFYAKMDSTLDHTDFSVDAEMFFSAAASLAFFNNDIKSVIDEAKNYTSGGEIFTQLYNDISGWYETLGEETTKHKIKSKYGDADFTSAPTNVGLAILSLLAYGDSFENILKSINYGHDSDCIIASAAALIGIIKGYDAIPQIWKDRIGNDLMVSQEITGFDIPETVDQLTEDTCRVGLSFIEAFGDINVSESEEIERFKFDSKPYALTSKVKEYPDVEKGTGGVLEIIIENLTNSDIKIELSLQSEVFKTSSAIQEVNADSSEIVTATLEWETAKLNEIRKGQYEKGNFAYAINSTVNGHTISSNKGIPYYGNWMMAGPFISDHKELIPMDKTYPDHGLPSMPSITYMNHDKADQSGDYLSWEVVNKLLKQDTSHLAFESQIVFPKSHTISLGDYFYGRGERTIYLLSKFKGASGDKKWLCIGAAGMVKVWHNRVECYASSEVRRVWHMAHVTQLDLAEENEILIRLDLTVDQFDVMVGFKHHLEKHAHQSQWDAELIPSV